MSCQERQQNEGWSGRQARTSRSFSASAKSPSRPALLSAARSRYSEPSGFLRGLDVDDELTFLGLRSVERSLLLRSGPVRSGLGQEKRARSALRRWGLNDCGSARFGGAIPKREAAGALEAVGERPLSEGRAGVASSERNAS